MGEIRPDWRTVARRDLRLRPQALAARPGTCSCGRDAETHEPIVLLGSQIIAEPDAIRTVDLTGAEWHPQHCLQEAAHG